MCYLERTLNRFALSEPFIDRDLIEYITGIGI